MFDYLDFATNHIPLFLYHFVTFQSVYFSYTLMSPNKKRFSNDSFMYFGYASKLGFGFEILSRYLILES